MSDGGSSSSRGSGGRSNGRRDSCQTTLLSPLLDGLPQMGALRFSRWTDSLHGRGIGTFHPIELIEHWLPHNSHTPETMGCFSEPQNTAFVSNGGGKGGTFSTGAIQASVLFLFYSLLVASAKNGFRTIRTRLNDL